MSLTGLISSLFFFFLSLTCPATCEAGPVEVQLLSTVTGVGKAKKILIGVEFFLEEGWKIYAPQEDETKPFEPPQLDFSDSSNVKSFEIFWPPADTFELIGEKIKGYRQHVIIPVKVTLKNPGSPLDLKVKVRYVTCRELCVPMQKELQLVIPATGFSPSKDSLKITRFLPSRLNMSQQKEEFSNTWGTFLWMILFAMIGGFILNFMPCVLPVLSLKLSHIVTSKSEFRNRRQDALWTIAGIMTAFLILAMVTIFLQRAGKLAGWGMHFQEPVFLAIMILVMVIFAFNLWGVFEVNLPAFFNRFMSRKLQKASHSPKVLSYFSGIFATFLATPCTAPFLGMALGYALTQGSFETLVIFCFLGIGFSTPYVLLSTFPQRWIPHPKPGAWMNILKKVLSFGLFVTALWLSFLLYSSLNHDRSQSIETSSYWQAFEPDDISDYVNQGKVVLIFITADWCLTCHVNESMALNHRKLKPLLRRSEVVAMRADWTKEDLIISEFLAEHQRTGIPFIAVYGPKASQGILLPEVITYDIILEAFLKAGLPEKVIFPRDKEGEEYR